MRHARVLHVVAGPPRLGPAIERTAAPTVVAATTIDDAPRAVDVVHAHERAWAAGERAARARGVPWVATVDGDEDPAVPWPDLVLVPDEAVARRLAAASPHTTVRVAGRARAPAELLDGTGQAAPRHHALSRHGAHALAADLDDWYGALVHGVPVRRSTPDPHPPSVTVVVPTHDRPGLLGHALDALAAQTYPADLVDLVVVDDASTDPDVGDVLAAAVERFGGRLTVLRNPHNLGAGPSRNHGVAAATGDIIAFTDDDCRPTATWLELLVSAFRTEVGLVQGRTQPDPALPRGPTSRSQWTSREAGLYETCNIAYRRAALDALGAPPFATELQDVIRRTVGTRVAAHGFGEDADLGWRVREAGYASRFVPEAMVHHHVFDHDLGHVLRRSLLAGAFPVLVAAHPQLRDTFLWRRWFLGRRHLLLGLAGVGLATARRPAGLLAIPYVLDVLRPDRPGRRARLRAAPVRALRDVVELGALVHGSVRTRTLVL